MNSVLNKEIVSTEVIVEKLVYACLEDNLKSFFPYYLTPQVKMSMPFKSDFWNWFEKMYGCARKNSTGAWRLALETCLHNPKATSYCFYDEVHKYPRLTIDITTEENEVCLVIMPF